MKKKIVILAVVLGLLMIALAAAVPRVIDLAPVKDRIAAELAGSLHARVTLESISLKLFPRPELRLHELQLTFADETVLSAPQAGISPSLRGLLFGRPQLVHVSLEQPFVRTSLPAPRSLSDETPAADVLQQQALQFLETALAAVPPCRVTASGGTASIAASDGSRILLEQITAKLISSPQALQLKAACTSGLWERLSAAVRCDDEQAGLRLNARGIDAARMISALESLTGNETRTALRAAQLRGTVGAVSLSLLLPLEGEEKRISVSGTASFEGMTLSLPDSGLDLGDLGGTVKLDNERMAISGLRARQGNCEVRNGEIVLERSAGYRPSRMSAAFELDLAEVPRFFSMIPSEALRGELALITNPEGTAEGTVEIEDRGSSFATKVIIDDLRLRAAYRSFPRELRLDGGSCSCRDGRLVFSGLSGKLGASRLPDVSLSFSLREGSEAFSASAAGANLSLDDLHRALVSFEGSRELVADVRSAQGAADIHSLSLRGPLGDPQSWDIGLRSSLGRISLDVNGLAGQLVIRSGELSADSKACSLTQADLGYLDARLKGSLEIEGYLDGLKRATASLQGTLEEQTLGLAEEYAGMPSTLRLRAPVSFKNSRLAWRRNAGVSFSGDMRLAGGVSAAVAVTADADTVDIRRLDVNDGDLQCFLRTRIEEDRVALTYKGELRKATIDRALQRNHFVQGWVRGDFTADFDQKHPRASTARGRLVWEDAGWFGHDNETEQRTSAAVTAQGSTLNIESADISRGPGSADIRGSIVLAEEGFVLDLDLTAAALDLDMQANAAAAENGSGSDLLEELWETPLRGLLRVNVVELTKRPLRLAPFRGELVFSDRQITLRSLDTKLCAITLPAEVKATPETVTLAAAPALQQVRVEEMLQCLFGGRAVLSGLADGTAEIAAEGSGVAALLDAMQGTFTVTGRSGRIYKSNLLTKILSFLSIRQLLTGGIMTSAQKGYAYKSLRVSGRIDGEVLHIDELLLDSSALGLLCKGTVNLKTQQLQFEALAAPIQIQDTLLSKLPFVGTTFSKPTIGVPLHISGTTSEPRVSPRAPSAAGALINRATSILKYPLKIIDAALPDKPADSQ